MRGIMPTCPGCGMKLKKSNVCKIEEIDVTTEPLQVMAKILVCKMCGHELIKKNKTSSDM